MPTKQQTADKSFKIVLDGKTREIFISNRYAPEEASAYLMPEGNSMISLKEGNAGWMQSKEFREDLIKNGPVRIAHRGLETEGPMKINPDNSNTPATWNGFYQYLKEEERSIHHSGSGWVSLEADSFNDKGRDWALYVNASGLNPRRYLRTAYTKSPG